jgi:ATP adenylyltransferase
MSENLAPDAGSIVDAGAGHPDRLQRLWTPYRMSYITGEV